MNNFHGGRSGCAASRMQFLWPLLQKLRGDRIAQSVLFVSRPVGATGFLLRGMALGITTGVLFVVGFTLFLHGALWWLGLLITIIAVATLLVCYASLVVRRLHDMNFSGYHAIWVVPVEIFGVLVPAALTSEGVDSRASMTRFSRSSP